jgi:hypothetical protein
VLKIIHIYILYNPYNPISENYSTYHWRFLTQMFFPHLLGVFDIINPPFFYRPWESHQWLPSTASVPGGSTPSGPRGRPGGAPKIWRKHRKKPGKITMFLR